MGRKNLNNYNNVVCSSYGGKNYGVDVSFDNNLNKYLLWLKKRHLNKCLSIF